MAHTGYSCYKFRVCLYFLGFVSITQEMAEELTFHPSIPETSKRVSVGVNKQILNARDPEHLARKMEVNLVSLIFTYIIEISERYLYILSISFCSYIAVIRQQNLKRRGE